MIQSRDVACRDFVSTMVSSFPTNQAIVVGGGLGGAMFLGKSLHERLCWR